MFQQNWQPDNSTAMKSMFGGKKIEESGFEQG